MRNTIVNWAITSRHSGVNLNVDEILLRVADQKITIRRLVHTVQNMSTLSLTIDSSNIKIVKVGFDAFGYTIGWFLLNSTSLERLRALDLAKHYNDVTVTSAGEKRLPKIWEVRMPRECLIPHSLKVLLCRTSKSMPWCF